jgi:putative DNA primase/helicase
MTYEPDNDDYDLEAMAAAPARPKPTLAAVRRMVDQGEAAEPMPAWMQGAPVDRGGGLKRSYLGCVFALKHHPELAERLAWCERRKRIEVTGDLPWHKAGGQVTDVFFSRCRGWLEAQLRVQWSKELVIEAAVHVAQERSRDPVVDYLRGLRWDGQPRIDRVLIEHGGAPDTMVVEAMTGAFFIGAARRALKPGCKHDCVLVLEGSQGRFKSQFVQVLGGEWADDNLATLDGVAAQQHVAEGPWLVEIAELTALLKADPARAKQFFSLREDRYRAPYDRVLASTPRRCAFVGTVNPLDGWLADATGGRRYWPVRIECIDLPAIIDLRDQLWAEAVAREAMDEPHWLRGQAELYAEAEQAERYQRDPWHDLIEHWVEDREPQTSRQLHDMLEIPVERRNNATNARIAKVMVALGYQPKRSKTARLWVRG